MTIEVETVAAQNARLRTELETERAIVDRVWKALGIFDYAGAKGKAIDELVAEAVERRPLTVDDAMITRALAGFDTGTGDPNDYRKRMRAALEAALVVSEANAWDILRPRITGFGKDHGDDHFDDSCERCALIVELDAAFSLARETASEHSAGDDITLPNNPKPNPGGGG